MEDIILVVENRHGGNPKFEHIQNRAVLFKLFDHSINGDELPVLAARDFSTSKFVDYFEQFGAVEMTPPNQTFVDDHLGLFDMSQTGPRTRLVKHAQFPYGMIYLTHHLGKNIFRYRGINRF